MTVFSSGVSMYAMGKLLYLLLGWNLDASMLLAAGVGGILLAIAAAYVARSFNNIMDVLRLVFAFVNAPLFATFALGMFWRRTTGHGAFFGLVSGTLAAAIHQGLSPPQGATTGLKGGYLGVVWMYPSELAQTFWTAIAASTTCAIVTVLVSLATRARPADELHGRVYSLTPSADGGDAAFPWYKRPTVLAISVLGATAALNVVLW